MDNSKPFELEKMQAELKEAGLDGWLFYDFRGLDPIAHSILRFAPGKMGTRRWFFFVPAEGEPSKLVHAIEAAALDHLPGSKIVYGTRQSLDAALQELRKESVDLGLAAAAKLVHESLDEKKDRELVMGFIEELSGGSEIEA